MSIVKPARSRAMLGIAAAAGLIFFILGYAGIWLSRESHVVSIIWVATAFAICLILRLCHNRREDALVLGAVFLAGIYANWLGGSSVPISIAFAAINAVAIILAIELTRRYARRRFISMSASLKFFALAGLVPSLAGAALSGIALHAMGVTEIAFGMRSWFFANLLGFFIVAPLGMTISLRELRKLKLPQRKMEVALTFAMLFAVTVSVYLMPRFSPLFLIIPAGLWATFRFRLLGASVSIILVSTTALLAHAFDFGGNNLRNPLIAAYVLQLFLAVCVMAFVPVAAFLNERDFHIAIIERRRQRAVQASKFKSQLLSHVSHEVRTPLSAIIGFSSMLESGLLSSDKAHEFAAMIARNGELLMRLHDDLLDFARAEAGTLVINRKTINAASALHSMMQRFMPLPTDSIQAPLIVDDIDTGLSLSADPLRLAQIMNNLVGNAQKYGDGFSPIVISARKLDDRFGRIEILNMGPGIHPEHRELIFQPFSRLESAKQNTSGAGLGLSITKMLVEIQGGRIDFESIPNRQTRFWVDLPLAA